jgi:hypothetical protein
MGLLGAAELVPYLLFAVHVGAWAGARRGRSLLIAADLGRAALLLSIPVAAALGGLSMGLLYAVAFGVGTLAVVFDVAYQTVFAELVDPGDYVVANSFLVGSRSVSIVGGKSAGGLLVAALTAPVAIIVDALSYLGSALFVSRTPAVDPPLTAKEAGGIGEGLRFIARTRLLRTTLAACATLNLFNSAFWAWAPERSAWRSASARSAASSAPPSPRRSAGGSASARRSSSHSSSAPRRSCSSLSRRARPYRAPRSSPSPSSSRASGSCSSTSASAPCRPR